MWLPVTSWQLLDDLPDPHVPDVLLCIPEFDSGASTLGAAQSWTEA